MINRVMQRLAAKGEFDPVRRMNRRAAYQLGRIASRASNPVCPYRDAELVAAYNVGKAGEDAKFLY